VSKDRLVRFDNNKYSVSASAIGRPVEVQAYADPIIIRQHGRIVAEHRSSFGRGDTIYDPWHTRQSLPANPALRTMALPLRNGSCQRRSSAVQGR
jgi:hypothetical protein